MEFTEKLKQLRKEKGLTQEELAEHLFVTRGAISKWESGRGYPNIDSLKMIAKFFLVTIDELVSGDEVLTIAKEEESKIKSHLGDLVFGLLDISLLLLFFLPFFANRIGENIISVSLIYLNSVKAYLKILYAVVIFASSLFGILTLAFQSLPFVFFHKSKRLVSLILNTLSVLLFTLSLQPYAAIFAFALLLLKLFLALKTKRNDWFQRGNGRILY